MKKLGLFFATVLLYQFAISQVEDSTLIKIAQQRDATIRMRMLIVDGWTFHAQDPKKALSYGKLAEKDTSDVNDYLLLDSLYRFKAFCYGDMNNRTSTLQSHLSRLRVLSKMKEPTKALASAYFETAATLANQENWGLAKSYYLKSASISEEIGFNTQLGQILITLADYDVDDGKLDSALIRLNRARELFIPIERLHFILGAIDMEIADVYDKQNKREIVIQTVDNGLKFADTLTYIDYNSTTYKKAGMLYLKYGYLDKALYNLHISERLCLRHNKMYYLPGVYKGLSTAYSNSDLEKSLHFLRKYVEINDSVINEKNNETLAKLRFEYEDEMKELEIANLEKDKMLVEAESKRKSSQLKLIAGALVLVVILSLFLISLVRKVRAKNKLVNEQKEMVEIRNKEIEDSINYAQRIQDAMIPDDERLKALFPDSFVFYLPKDNLSGDFYWSYLVHPNDKDTLKLFAVGDCTGHGIPGALLSILGINFLNLGAVSETVNSPAQALDYLDFGFQHTFGHSQELIRDGMDIVLGAIDPKTNMLYYCCAKNPIFIVRGEELMDLRGDKKAIGNDEKGEDFTFSDHSIQLEKGDMIYAFSDGFQDQFGGEKGKKFRVGNFKKLLIQMSKDSADAQQQRIETEFYTWKNDLEQIDDVTILGIRV